MKKHGTTLALFALASFYYLTTDVILTDETVNLLGQEKVILVYAFAMLFLGAGFALFSLLHARASGSNKRKLMLSIVFFSSALLLILFVLVGDPIAFLLFSFMHMLATGIIGGAVHYYAAMALRDQVYSGRVIGFAIGTAALLQVLLLTATASSLFRALILVGVLGVIFYLVLCKTPVAIKIQKPRQTPPANFPARGYLCSIVTIVAVISLMGGFNDGIITSMHMQQIVNIYTFPRFFYLVGIVTAGFIADIQGRRYLPVVMLAIMMFSSVGVTFLHDPLTYLINVCIFFLFAGFAIMYFTVTFFDIAPFTKNPMLWAGMGRIVRFIFIAIGSLSSDFIFTNLPFNGIIAIYICLSVILLFLFYLSGSFAVKKHSMTASGSAKAQMIKKSTSFNLTRRESEILSCLIENTPIREIAQNLDIAERTVKFHISNIFDKTGAKNRLELLIILSKTKDSEAGSITE